MSMVSYILGVFGVEILYEKINGCSEDVDSCTAGMVLRMCESGSSIEVTLCL